MLLKLIVKNYAIIDHIEIPFSGTLNIITGETGAGKSILLGALSMVLGERADGRALFDPQQKCIVEAAFNVASYGLEDFFTEHDLDYEPVTTVRREINAAGKSRAFINDTPVNLPVLKELGAQLVNLHSQHETLELSSASFQLQLLDAVSKHEDTLRTFREQYRQYRKDETKLNKLITDARQNIGDLDYLTFQYKELEDANLQPEEQEALENELKLLENTEEVRAGLHKIETLLNDDEAAIALLNNAATAFSAVQQFDTELEKLAARLESTIIELEDISSEVSRISSRAVNDPERLEIVNDRLNIINRQLAKHHVKDVKELIAIRDNLQVRIHSATHSQEEIDELRKQLEVQKDKLLKTGRAITANRKKQVKGIEEEVASRLAYVGMPDARLIVEMEELPFEKITATGLDKVRFLFTANKGSRPEELKRVASGGELSRLMLVLKSLIAANTALPTLIFDEIDTGISGEVAYKVGQVLEQLGEAHQVISITHLPQIASKGQTHFFVYKGLEKNKTVTRIRQLTEEERTTEIAKMLGGEKITEATLVSAKELLG